MERKDFFKWMGTAASLTAASLLPEKLGATAANKEESTALSGEMPVDSGASSLINKPLTMTDLHFKRIASFRNVYNHGLLMNEISLSYPVFDENTNRYPASIAKGSPAFRHIANQIDLENKATTGSAEGDLLVGAFFPYATYDVQAASASGKITVRYGNERASLKIYFTIREGKATVSTIETIDGAAHESKLSLVIPAVDKNRFHIRLQLTGSFGHPHQIDVSTFRAGHTTYQGSIPYTIDLTGTEAVRSSTWAIGGSVLPDERLSFFQVKCWYGCGYGQADPRPVNYEDGSPVIKDGKLFFTTSFRSADILGVMSLRLNTMEWKCEGVALYESDGKICNYVASTFIYDRREKAWIIYTPAHGGNHHIFYGTCNKNPLHGLTYIRLLPFDYPALKGDEDISVFYQEADKNWYAAYATLGDGKYYLSLCKAKTPQGTFSEVASTRSLPYNVTGVNIQKIGGERVVLCGSDKGYLIFSFPELTFRGKFSVDHADGGYRGWGTVVPFPDGIGTRYLWLTFDRGKGNPGYNWSYGGLYLYVSEERNEGDEYPSDSLF